MPSRLKSAHAADMPLLAHKVLRDAAERTPRLLAAGEAHLAWALRDRLRGFLDTYEQGKRDRAVVDFQDLAYGNYPGSVIR